MNYAKANKIIIILCVVALALALLWRQWGNINGPGIDGVRNAIADCENINKNLQNRIDASGRTVENIECGVNDATAGIERAKSAIDRAENALNECQRIIENAKRRNETPGH